MSPTATTIATTQSADRALDLEELTLMVSEGIPLPDAATELGISLPTVYRMLSGPAILNTLRTARNARVVATYEKGYPLREILNHFKISQGTLYRILANHDPPVLLRRPPSAQTPDEKTAEKQRIVELYTSGYGVLYIRRSTKRSYTYIYDVLRERNVPLRRPGTRR